MKSYIVKIAKTEILKRLILLFAGELVKRTDNKLDDKVYKVIEGTLNG